MIFIFEWTVLLIHFSCSLCQWSSHFFFVKAVYQRHCGLACLAFCPAARRLEPCHSGRDPAGPSPTGTMFPLILARLEWQDSASVREISRWNIKLWGQVSINKQPLRPGWDSMQFEIMQLRGLKPKWICFPGAPTTSDVPPRPHRKLPGFTKNSVWLNLDWAYLKLLENT